MHIIAVIAGATASNTFSEQEGLADMIMGIPPDLLSILALFAGLALQTLTIIYLYTRLRAANQELAERDSAKGPLSYATLDRLEDMALALRPDGAIAFANNAACLFFGYQPGELTGKSFADLLPVMAQNGRSAADILTGLLKDPENHTHMDLECRRKEGGRAWVDWRSKPSLDAGGKLSSIVCLGRDSTRDRAERTETGHLRMALEQTIDGVAMCDLEGKLLYANQAWAAMHGFLDAEELPGQSLSVFHTPEQLVDEVIPFNRKVLEKGYNQAMIGHMRRDGMLFQSFMSVSLIKDQDEVPLGYLAIARDVTEQQRTREELNRSSAWLRALVESTDDCVVLCDRVARPVIFNQAYKDMVYDLTGMDMRPGVKPHDFLPDPKVRAVWESYYKRVMEGERFRVEYDQTLRNGRTRRYETSYNPIYSQDEVSGFSVFTRDITKRREMVSNLAESESRFSQLVNNLKQAFWLCDESGMLYVSPGYERIFGPDVESLMADPYSYIASIHPSDKERIEAYVRSKEYRSSGIFDEEYRILPPDGGLRWVRARTWPVEQGAGADERRVVGMAEDITEYKDIQHRLKVAITRAETAMHAKSQFLANMSHEIRTPLNGVLGMLQLLDMSELSQEQEKWTATATQSAQGLLELLNDILDLSKIESGNVTLELRPFMPAELLANVRSVFEGQVAAKGLVLETELAPDAPKLVTGDVGRIRQILFNLVGNAVKFTEQGTVRVELSVIDHPREEGLQMILAVNDTGIGIPQSAIETIFENFVQVDESLTKRQRGVGLGLAIVRSLVKLMQGTVWVDSREGEGTSVYAAFPVDPADEDACLAADQGCLNPGREEEPEPVAKGRLLLAEDEEINQELLKLFLAGEGWEVTVVGDGQAVLDAVQQAQDEGRPFQVLVMDIRMPELDGLSATRIIRESGREYARVPILALTAHALSGDRERFLEQGVSEYLAKPVRFNDLRAKLEAVLSKK